MKTVKKYIDKYSDFLLKNFDEDQNYESGLMCTFIPVDEFGIKMYEVRRKRDECYTWQRKAYLCDLGPQTLCKFDVTIGSIKYYCYVTEIVKPICTGTDDFDYVDETENEYEQAIKSLNLDMSYNIGFDMKDSWGPNYGINHAGKLVCIDFGND